MSPLCVAPVLSAAWLSPVLLKEGSCYKNDGKEWPIVNFLSTSHSPQKRKKSVTSGLQKTVWIFPMATHQGQSFITTALWCPSRGAPHDLVYISTTPWGCTEPTCTTMCSISDEKSSLSVKYRGSYEHPYLLEGQCFTHQRFLLIF